MLPVEQPFKTYTGLDGKPLNNGYVYFGQPNQNPITSPVTVYWDAAGTIPAAQPLRTVNGYIMRGGAPANIFFNGAYSEVVLDAKQQQVFYGADSSEYSIYTPVGAALDQINSRLDTFNQPTTNQRFAEGGAHINRVNDRLFVGKTATSYDGRQNPVAASWVGEPVGGIFEYLEVNSTLLAYAEGSGLGMFSAARTSATSGMPAEVAIGSAAFAHNDLTSGSAGAWCFYGTALREAGANGSTLGIEIDVANMGATAVCFPGQLFPSGLSAGLWIASGGEATNNQHVGTASAAMVILSNDGGAHPTVAKFEKGIVFHSKAIEGCDGDTGMGVAIAFAKGHQQTWFNNTNQAVAEIVCTNNTFAAAARLDFTDYGVIIKDRATDGGLFQVQAVPNAVNHLSAVASAAGAGVVDMQALGADANIDLRLSTKGTGVVQVNYGTSAATTAANFSATRRLAIKDGNGTTWYIPLSSIAW